MKRYPRIICLPRALLSVNKILLVAQGMSNLEISAALNITESTVKSNINCILSKLGAIKLAMFVNAYLRRASIA